MIETNNIVYQFWTGDNDMSENRKTCLQTSQNLGVKTILITKQNLNEYINEHPLHKAYQFLSDIHKSDYLRCYFMHFYGGGYADIKNYSKNNNWSECFKLINENEHIEIIGQKEIVGGSPLENLNHSGHINKIIANGYFIARKNSDFTNCWYKKLTQKLDEKYEILKNNPSKDPLDRSLEYPIRWAELCGEILHQIEFDFYFSHPGSVNNSLESGRLNTSYR